jgi:hypothetical protein
MEYPTDLDLNSDKDIHIDGSNDLATVSGIEQLEQSVAIDVMDEVQEFIGGRVTGKNLGLLEERFRQAINEDPQVVSVRTLNITEYDRRTDTISVEISTIENEDFTLEVSA